MKAEIINQAYLFMIYFISGIVIGILFDLFRILRLAFKTADIITYIEDILFGILTGFFLIFIIFVFNNGELRFYIFLALVLGTTTYLLTISKYFIKFNVKIIATTKYIIGKILALVIYPMKTLTKFIKRIALKPFKILTINMKKTLKSNKIKKYQNIKKDFSK